MGSCKSELLSFWFRCLWGVSFCQFLSLYFSHIHRLFVIVFVVIAIVGLLLSCSRPMHLALCCSRSIHATDVVAASRPYWYCIVLFGLAPDGNQSIHAGFFLYLSMHLHRNGNCANVYCQFVVWYSLLCFCWCQCASFVHGRPVSIFPHCHRHPFQRQAAVPQI